MLILSIIFCFSISGKSLKAESNSYLKDGEKLSYLVKWTGFNAGTIDLETKRNQKLENKPYEIHLKAISNRMVSMFYKVNNDIISRIDDKQFKSKYYYKNIRQGKRHLEEITHLKYDEKKIKYSKQNISAKEKPGLKDFKMSSSDQLIQDPLSLIYFMRTLSFSEKKEKKGIKVFADKGIYQLDFKVIKKMDMKSLRFGTRSVYVIEPNAKIKGVFIKSGKLKLWIDQKTMIPLRMEFSIPVGWASLELNQSNHPNLKPSTYQSRRRGRNRYRR